MPIGIAAFRKTGTNLSEMTGAEGSLSLTLKNIQTLTSDEGKLGKTFDHLAEITGPESALAHTLQNTEKFTASLTNNRDVEVTLRNFRMASENLSRTITNLGTQFSAVGENLNQASDTVKRQPWRLIWPSTKNYDEPAATPIPVKRAIPVRKAPARR